MKLVALCVLWLALGTGILAEDATELAYIRQALAKTRMTLHDLGFKKDVAESELVFPEARRFLCDPLALPTYAGEMMTNLRNTRFGASRTNTVEHIYQTVLGIQSLLPKPNRAAFEAWAMEFISDKADRRRLVPDLFRRDESLELQDDELANAILDAPLNRAALLSAFHKLSRAVEQAAAKLGTNDFTRDTPLGKIICTSQSGQTFTDESLLIVATGNDNLFLNSAGGANGLAGRPISIVIATGHGNRYVSTNIVAQGAGLFGIGILADFGSNSTFTARHIAQGAGLFGCGALITGKGRQKFVADSFCQGAGMFGAGILWQRGGDTSYRAADKAQGFGGVNGYGLILDESGDDSYFAGGKYPCSWTPGQNFSLSQGFGFGMRPFAGGGIGVLCDLAGNDRYEAGVYGQGASYWYSVGLLLDREGNDTYKAHQYCQGAGIHLSSGALIDWSGDDTYTAHAICQGAAHDYGVGMLIDRAGDDRYTGVSTAQGAALHNSFAMLLDRCGDDRYVGTDPKQSQASGHDGGRREYGSIALLLDLGGDDSYSQGWRNNSTWTKPFYGLGLDCEARPVFWSADGRAHPPGVPPSEPERTSRRLVPTSHVDVRHPIERLVRKVVSDTGAEAANKELKARAAEVLPYLLTRVDSPNVSLRSKVEELVDIVGTNAAPMLAKAIRSAKSDEAARVCCYFLARFETAANAIPSVLPLLEREKTRATALYTLGHLRAREAFDAALALLDDKDELVRLRAAQALGRIGDARAIPKLTAALRDEWWDVRFAAEDALARIRKR
jgi:hypothetical protein